MSGISNSRSMRVLTMSKCRSPKNPARKPKPRAVEVSAANENAESVR